MDCLGTDMGLIVFNYGFRKYFNLFIPQFLPLQLGIECLFLQYCDTNNNVYS